VARDRAAETGGIGGYHEGIGWIVSQIGAERFVLSSRTPILSTEAPKGAFETPDLDEAGKQLILDGNAARLLGQE
jgi:hypothetical protein